MFLNPIVLQYANHDTCTGDTLDLNISILLLDVKPPISINTSILSFWIFSITSWLDNLLKLNHFSELYSISLEDSSTWSEKEKTYVSNLFLSKYLSNFFTKNVTEWYLLKSLDTRPILILSFFLKSISEIGLTLLIKK